VAQLFEIISHPPIFIVPAQQQTGGPGINTTICLNYYSQPHCCLICIEQFTADNFHPGLIHSFKCIPVASFPIAFDNGNIEIVRIQTAKGPHINLDSNFRQQLTLPALRLSLVEFN